MRGQSSALQGKQGCLAQYVSMKPVVMRLYLQNTFWRTPSPCTYGTVRDKTSSIAGTLQGCRKACCSTCQSQGRSACSQLANKFTGNLAHPFHGHAACRRLMLQPGGQCRAARTGHCPAASGLQDWGTAGVSQPRLLMGCIPEQVMSDLKQSAAISL